MAGGQGAERQDLDHPHLTQATDAEIGAGFRACTRPRACSIFPRRRRSSAFSTPAGLGEAGYDPGSDIAFCEGRAHLILAVVKALDCRAAGGARRDARRRGGGIRTGRSWWRRRACMRAIAQGAAHVLPYPFADDATSAAIPDELATVPWPISARCLKALPGKGGLSFVPIDFTQPGDGFEPADYGREALVDALIAAAPAAVAVALAELPGTAVDTDTRKADAHILGFARGRGRQRCRAGRGRGGRADGAGGDAAPAGQAPRRATGTGAPMRSSLARSAPATLVRTASTLRHPPARQADPGLRPDRGAAAAAAASFADHLCHGQGRRLFPGAPPAAACARRKWLPSTAQALQEPFASPRSARSATAAAGASREQPRPAAIRASSCWSWRCCCRPRA